MAFVTFEALKIGDFFRKDYKWWRKTELTLWDSKPDIPKNQMNARTVGHDASAWKRFDDVTLVTPYDTALHGKPPEITWLRDAF